jgi:hypothetical protein
MKTDVDRLHRHMTKYHRNYIGKPSIEIIGDYKAIQNNKVTALGKELADLVTRKNTKF